MKLLRCISLLLLVAPAFSMRGGRGGAGRPPRPSSEPPEERCSLFGICIIRRRCGPPPTGDTNTITINTSTPPPPYPVRAQVSYTCKPGYHLTTSDENCDNKATIYCQSDRSWPPAPVCVANICKGSTLSSLDNANFLPQDVLVGETITYTCSSSYRIAPTFVTNTEQNQVVTCQADGTFTELEFICVYMYAESCRDYYARDGTFVAANDECVTVTIDPEGPNADPPSIPVECCKASGTQVCTKIAPTENFSYDLVSPDNACNSGSSSTVMPTTVFNTAKSQTCGSAQVVNYAIADAFIKYILRNSCGTCKQTVSVDCAVGARSLALALNYAGEGSGFLYGTNAFTRSDHLRLDHYTYAGAACDCAHSSTAINDGDACEDGCKCPLRTQRTTSATDTITRVLDPDGAFYVKSYQVTAHLGQQAQPSGAMSVNVQPITCCEEF